MDFCLKILPALACLPPLPYQLAGLLPDILRVLRRSPEPRGSGMRSTVTIAGFPAASCAATSATVEPIDSQTGTRLLSQWKSIGVEGAWYLPPQLGTTKLLLVVKCGIACRRSGRLGPEALCAPIAPHRRAAECDLAMGLHRAAR